MQPSVLSVEAGHVTVKLAVHGDRICQSILAGKPFERESLKAWADLCRAGGAVLDVGAYTGLYAILAAKMGCRVMAFEPLKDNAARCRSNSLVNGVRFPVRQAAVADRVGRDKFNYNGAVKGLTSGGSLGEPSGIGKGARIQTQDVSLITIDSLALPECAAIKIDIERKETLALAGAQETLQRCRPALLVEVLGEAEERAVRAAVPNYRVERELDGRNWLMVPT